MLKRYIGDKAFYRHVMAIALPIIIQNLIMNFVALLESEGYVKIAEHKGKLEIYQKEK